MNKKMFDELPIWHNGRTLTRGLTLEESRALAHAFRSIKEAHGVLLYNQALTAETQAQKDRDARRDKLILLRTLWDILYSNNKEQTDTAIEKARKILSMECITSAYPDEDYGEEEF